MLTTKISTHALNIFLLDFPLSPQHPPTYTCHSSALQRPAHVPHSDSLHSKELLKLQGRSNMSACHHFTFIVSQGCRAMLWAVDEGDEHLKFWESPAHPIHVHHWEVRGSSDKQWLNGVEPTCLSTNQGCNATLLLGRKAQIRITISTIIAVLTGGCYIVVSELLIGRKRTRHVIPMGYQNSITACYHSQKIWWLWLATTLWRYTCTWGFVLTDTIANFWSDSEKQKWKWICWILNPLHSSTANRHNA